MDQQDDEPAGPDQLTKYVYGHTTRCLAERRAVKWVLTTKEVKIGGFYA